MAKKKYVPAERDRREMRSVYRGVWVVCKCPFCGVLHKEEMAVMPLVMPRRFCVLHRKHREVD